jgi:hypothetical protein
MLSTTFVSGWPFITFEQPREKRRSMERVQILLTFGDGFRSQFEVVKRVLLRPDADFDSGVDL